MRVMFDDEGSYALGWTILTLKWLAVAIVGLLIGAVIFGAMTEPEWKDRTGKDNFVKELAK